MLATLPFPFLTLTLGLLCPQPLDRVTMDIQGRFGFDVVLDDGRIEGNVYYLGVDSRATLEATEDGWGGTVARFRVTTTKVSNARFELELTPIMDGPTSSPMPREPYSTQFQFEVKREDGGWVDFRGWSGIRDSRKLHARVSTDEGRLWLSAGDGGIDHTVELRRDDTGTYRGTRLDVVESSGTLPFDRDVRLTSSGALDLASVLHDDPVLFSILYIVFPTLPQFSW